MQNYLTTFSHFSPYKLSIACFGIILVNPSLITNDSKNTNDIFVDICHLTSFISLFKHKFPTLLYLWAHSDSSAKLEITKI